MENAIKNLEELSLAMTNEPRTVGFIIGTRLIGQFCEVFGVRREPGTQSLFGKPMFEDQENPDGWQLLVDDGTPEGAVLRHIAAFFTLHRSLPTHGDISANIDWEAIPLPVRGEISLRRRSGWRDGTVILLEGRSR